MYTPYCHMIYQNSKKNQLRVRLSLVRQAQKHGIKPTARKFGCNKNTVKLWLKRYLKLGTSGLLSQHKGPNNIPHKTCKKIEELIIQSRKEAPCYGPKRLKWAYDIKVSEGAIARILRDKKLVRKKRKKYEKKRDLREVKAKYKAFSHTQEDVKHLYDIPYYFVQFQKKSLYKYQYTIRDTKSSFLALAYSREISELYSTIFTEKYLNHLKSFKISSGEIIIQIDNGFEFGYKKRNIKTPGFVNSIEEIYGAKHQYIPPGMCNANADVESIHATIKQKLFDLESFRDKNDFITKLQSYQNYYNMVRPNFSKKGKTPWQIISKDRPKIDPKILLFPVLDLDFEFKKYYNKKLIDLGGQEIPIFPVYLF